VDGDHHMIDKETFLKARLPEREVDLPGVGTVRVRGLTRAEALEVQALQGDVAAMEQKVIHFGLVDPVLTNAEIACWYGAVTAGEIDLLVNPISEMSGLTEGAPKRGVPEVRGRS
jgi:hypothetical protein